MKVKIELEFDSDTDEEILEKILEALESLKE